MNYIDKDGIYIGIRLYEYIDKINIELNKKITIKTYIANFFTFDTTNGLILFIINLLIN